MITCCIDVGLRHLAFSILNSDYEILLWDVFNVLDNDDYKCEGKFKNGEICGRKCSMKYIPEDLSTFIYCCKSHYPKKNKKTKLNDFKKKNINEYLLQDIAKLFIQRVQDIYDENPVFKEIDNILIELQPKCNSKMVFTSHILYGKLTELYNNTPVTVRFVRASQKLKAYNGPMIECKLKGAYSKRKYLSVKYTEWFLKNKFLEEQKDKWLPFFEAKKIKADMADCFLMAINSITGIPKKHFKHKNGNEIK
jgi:hypothetical protein